ncbi:MAG: DUF917 family protein [Anaerococcus sp.]
MRIINENDVKNLAIGGTILGGGGGGSRHMGLKDGLSALSQNPIKLVDIEELSDDDLVICASMVGAPSSKESYVDEKDYAYLIEEFNKYSEDKIKAIFTNENGGGSSFNGFILSSLTNIPLISTIANGRAHPTGVMGSLNLHKIKDYKSIQVYAGGNPELGKNVRGIVESSINNSSKTIREAAVIAGGLVAVLRNPVKASYLKENGAKKALEFAMDLGKTFNQAKESVREACEFLGGEIIGEGKVEDFSLTMKGGFDVGKFKINNLSLNFWNEYMTFEKDGKEIYKFPDLIMTFDKNTSMPITSAEIKENMEVIVIGVKKEKLLLGSPMFEKDLLDQIDSVIK